MTLGAFVRFIYIKEEHFIRQHPGQPSNDKDRALVNENIRFPTVMLIGPNGEKLGIKSLYDAKRIAESHDMDLYCVAPSGNPPVCKVLNYGKFRFDQLKKEKENRKNQKIVEVKEQRLSPVIDDHDIDTKVRNTIKWLESGDKVKVSVRFRGRQITHPEIGEEILNRFLEKCADHAVVEKKPVLDGKFLIAFIAPKKK